MIEIDDKIVSVDLLRECFACDLEQCKGICCVEGNAGAPLEEDEVDLLEQEWENYRPCMTEAGIEAVERQGFMVYDEEGGLHHPARRRCRMRLLLPGERDHLLRDRTGLERGADDVPQADLLPPLPHSARNVFERQHRIELPSLGGVPFGPRVRPEVGPAGLQGAARAHHPSFRRGVLRAVGGGGRSASRER